MGGSLTEEEITTVLDKFPAYKAIKTFVETGTYKGETSRLASKVFDVVHTIEIMPSLYQEARLTGCNAGITNIIYHLGDSVQILKHLQLVPVPSVFFIDAHQSGCDTGNNGTNVPLLQELDVILEKNMHPCIFIFDDVRLFDKYWDWKNITETSILAQFKGRDKHSFVSNDRLVVYT